MLRSLTSLPCQNFKIGRVCPGRTPPTNIYDVNIKTLAKRQGKTLFFRAQENESVCSSPIKISYMEKLNDRKNLILILTNYQLWVKIIRNPKGRICLNIVSPIYLRSDIPQIFIYLYVYLHFQRDLYEEYSF